MVLVENGMQKNKNNSAKTQNEAIGAAMERARSELSELLNYPRPAVH